MAELHGLLLQRYYYAHGVATKVDAMPLSKYRLLEKDSLDFALGYLGARKRALKLALKQALKEAIK